MRRSLLALVCASAISACGASDQSSPTSSSSQSSAEHETITVFAAASLTESFNDIGTSFEAEHPRTDIVFSFGSSSELAAQISEGAPADVFASADWTAMDRAVDGLTSAGTPVVFASNTAEVAVEHGNPRNIHGVSDLANPELIVVVCAPEVPCGRYATQVFDRAGVVVRPASFEANVKAVASKVSLGEADAGLVYHSDIVAGEGKIDGVAIPASQNVIAEYPIVALNNEHAHATTRAFIEYVAGPTGQAILNAHGFTTPATRPATAGEATSTETSSADTRESSTS